MLLISFLMLILTICWVCVALAPKDLVKKLIKYANEDSQFMSLLIVAVSIFGLGILLIISLLMRLAA